MPALVAGIHAVTLPRCGKMQREFFSEAHERTMAWVPATSAGMTARKLRDGRFLIRSLYSSASIIRARARSFSVSLFNCPQAARMSRPRGVRTGLA